MVQMVERLKSLEQQSQREPQAMRSNQYELLRTKKPLESQVGQLRVETARSDAERDEYLRSTADRLAAKVKAQNGSIQSSGKGSPTPGYPPCQTKPSVECCIAFACIGGSG